MNDWLSLEQLVDFVEGRLSAAESERITARLGADPEAAATVAWLAETIGLMRSDDSVDAPEQAMGQLLRMLPAAPPLDLAAPLRRLVATLRFDSLATSMAAGLRGAAEGVRRLLFTAGDLDLDVRVSGDEVLSVAGQVLGPGGGGVVELVGERATLRADLNALNEFSLPLAPPGVYRLVLTMGDQVIETPPFEIS